MNTSEIHPLPKRKFGTLMRTRNLYCTSIYLPMDKMGKEQNQHLAQARLKKCISEATTALASHQLQPDEIREYLKPVGQLLENAELWRNPSDGLAIFIDPDNGMQYYKIPIPFKAHTYVAGHFYLLPLLPLYHNDGRYYLLELSQDYVKLYEGSRHHFKDAHLETVAPRQLEDAVGYDYGQKNLQFRTGHAAHGASFHASGTGKEDEKNEVLRYFRAIDTGVRKIVSDTNAPLVLSCSDGLYGLYAQVNSHKNLYGEHLAGDPQFKNDTQRHQESWQMVAPYFEKGKTKKLFLFKEQYNTTKTGYEIDSIVPAAIAGRIATLFIEAYSDIFGVYDEKDNEVITDSKHEIHNVSLTNMAALQTFGQRGEVYLLPSEEMPVKGSTMNALFRY